MIQNPNEPLRKPTMSSREAAALLMSDGLTTDPELASTMQKPLSIQDMMNGAPKPQPTADQIERTGFAAQIGFDFSILEDDKTGRWIVRDDELGIQITTPFSKTADFDEDAKHLANACMKLKKKHAAYVKKQQANEAETDAA